MKTKLVKPKRPTPTQFEAAMLSLLSLYNGRHSRNPRTREVTPDSNIDGVCFQRVGSKTLLRRLRTEHPEVFYWIKGTMLKTRISKMNDTLDETYVEMMEAFAECIPGEKE